MTDPIRMTLPLPENLTNVRHGRSRHWRAREKEKRAYWTRLDMLRYTRKLPPAPAKPMPQAEITAVLHMWNFMDDDNAMARLKWVVDWLRKRGYLMGDSRKHLRYAGIPAQHIDRHEPRIELVITPVTF
jgi:hypothetical protein